MTVPWQHTEHVSIVIEVDTSPFDGSVARCNERLFALGGAVVAMNTAQCVVIAKGATLVSEHLQKGFFGTIKLELGQQMALLKNEFEAKLGLLVQQSGSSKSSLERMQRDFQRIASRYQELFRNLDEECRRRVLELERPSFRMAGEVVGTLLTQKRLLLAARCLTIPREIGESQSVLVVSRIRRKALGMLESARLHLTQERDVGRSLQEILLPELVDDRKTFRLPVLVMVADGEDGTRNTTVRGPEGLARGAMEAVKASVIRDPENADSWTWTPLPSMVLARLQREFTACVAMRFGSATSEAELRTATLAVQLWQSSSPTCVSASLQENP